MRGGGSVALAAALFGLLLLATGLVAARPASGPGHDRYVIYYGWLVNGPDGAPNRAARRIAETRPQILIASFHTETPRLPNLSRQVRDLMRAADIRVYAYVTTSYGRRELPAVMEEAREYLAAGVDGIFFDEAYDFADDAKLEYYRSLYTLVKASDRGIIVNPGDAGVGEAIMTVADMVMIEHQWRWFYQHIPWRAKYAPERFMGTSSNEPGAIAYLGYPVDLPSAVRDTREAWANGIGWHYSTDEYTELPRWYLDYSRSLRQ